MQISLILEAIPLTFKKLNPTQLIHNPVMFTVEIGAFLCTIICVTNFTPFTLNITIWLWVTILFANFSEAIAEGHGKAQTESLKATRNSTLTQRKKSDGTLEEVNSTDLKIGDVVVCKTGDTIPGDGEIVSGIASIDESAITGESAPVIREAGGDFSSVTGGTTILSDQILVKITTKNGETFLDNMIKLVEGTKRTKTPNEIALNVLLIVLTLIFLISVITLSPIANFVKVDIPVVILVALLVCLIPTTISALIPAIGIAGMNRLMQHKVLAKSGKAVETAGDIDTLLLDKTGTITFGNRQAVAFFATKNVAKQELISKAKLSSLADATPEGKSIVSLAVQLETELNLEQKTPNSLEQLQIKYQQVQTVDFSANTRMSGINLGENKLRKGAANTIFSYVKNLHGTIPNDIENVVKNIASSGGTALLVADGNNILGAIHLSDVVKPGIVEKFKQLKLLGIRTIMVTGDSEATAAAIAKAAGVDDFVAQATPEDKIKLIRAEQKKGHLIAMTGDGTNDAPALAAADIGVAMNSGTQAAKEAANMVDLDSDPTKLIAIINVGKQLLMTRGALTTFSITNDIAKYFAIVPAIFSVAFPSLKILNIMQLSNQSSAVLSAVIFNALIIVALIPLALQGVSYKPSSGTKILRKNMLIYGLGGLIVPFVGIKFLDILLANVFGVG